MTEEIGISNIVYLQAVQSKSLVLLLLVFIISIIGKMNFTPTLTLDILFFGSGYFLFYLLSTILANALHERGHILKLQELGYQAINFKAHRVGNVSFSIENVENMTADETYQVASAPFRQFSFYITEFISLLTLVGISLISPFLLDIFLLAITGLISISFLGSLCAFVTIQKQLASGFCVKLARTVTSRGDIDDIVTWNTMHEKGK